MFLKVVKNVEKNILNCKDIYKVIDVFIAYLSGWVWSFKTLHCTCFSFKNGQSLKRIEFWLFYAFFASWW